MVGCEVLHGPVALGDNLRALLRRLAITIVDKLEQIHGCIRALLVALQNGIATIGQCLGSILVVHALVEINRVVHHLGTLHK
jgi:hypothetical protein